MVTEQTDALGGWKGRGSQPTLYNLASKGWVGTPLIRRVQNQISRRRSSFAPPCQELPKGGRTASQAVEPSQTDVSIVGHRAGGVEPHPSVNSFGLRADGRFRGVERPKKPAHALQPGPRKAARYTPNQTRPSPTLPSIPLVSEQTDALGEWKGRRSQPTLYNLGLERPRGTPLIRRVLHPPFRQFLWSQSRRTL